MFFSASLCVLSGFPDCPENNKKSHTERQKHKVIRLFENAYKQGALLTHSDVAFLLHTSTGTVGKDVREYINDTNKVVHTRGIVHDIGPSLTHKKIIVTLWYKGYLEPEISRMTDHSEKAVHRYVKAAQRVEIAMESTDNSKKISQLLGMSESLALVIGYDIELTSYVIG